MSFLKVPIYRNPKLLALAKEAPYCFGCRKHADGTIVATHGDFLEMGKCKGMKSADLPAYLCHECHTAIHNGHMGDFEEMRAYWYRAACLSMRWALENYPEVFR